MSEEKINPEEVTKKPTTKKPTSKKVTKKNQFLTDNPYPTLYVKNFGKIEEAEVELAPFTLFVGDNNSGKSYLMNLIWGLQTYPYFHFRNLKPNNKKINKFFENLNVISENKITGAQKIVLTEDHVIELLEMLNTVLDDNKNQIAQHILNDANTSISELQLKISKKIINSISLTIDISLDEDKDWNLDISSNIQNHAGITIYDPIDSELSDYLEEFLEEIMGVLVRSIFKNSDTTFLPASRTGFLLTHELINIDTWGKRFNKKNDAKKMREIVFLRSVNSFVQDLMKLPLLEKDRESHSLFPLIQKTVTDKFQTYVEFIQTHLIYGNIFIDNNDKKIKYQPIGSDTALSMHVSSSVVTEIAPLALFLQYGVLQDTLFMEEPEISLHPQLQQQIARLLIKLVAPDSGGKQVFITTHSDTIIQHINNMIKLANNPTKNQKELLKEFNFEEDDIINFDRIRMYQFDVQRDTNNKTIVKPLKSTKYGFEVPTFNNFIRSMSKQIDQLLDEM